jgi:nitrite reductase/ring-hydroxylating ferredoxin subunit
MKEVDVEGTKVLLIREDDNYYALGNKCPFSGENLIKGVIFLKICKYKSIDYVQVLNNKKIRSLSGTCYNITDGKIEQFPGCEDLSCFETEVIGNADRIHFKMIT